MSKLSVLPELDQIYQADCLPYIAKNIPDNSIDLVVCDPPYGYSFLGKHWDTFNEVVEPKGAYQKQMGFKKLPRNKPTCMYENFVPIWKECLRILKPGAFMFVMSAPRQDTLLEQIRAIKDAGFRVNFSSIYWAYASGFPKASNISKLVDRRLGVDREIIGERKVQDIRGNNYSPGKKHNKIVIKKTRATSHQAKALDGSYGGFQPKPAVEIIVVAMKPLSQKTYLDQAIKNGKGITWLDKCRMPYPANEKISNEWPGYSGGYEIKNANKDYKSGADTHGRFPANLLVSDDVLNGGESSKSGSFSKFFSLDNWALANIQNTFPFLITPKPSKREKNKGCENLEANLLHEKAYASSIVERVGYKVKNNHPTVKPIKLMSYLITLGSRKGDIILDPFSGSGTTALAAQQLGRKYIGIEKEKEYCQIAKARLSANLESLKKAA